MERQMVVFLLLGSHRSDEWTQNLPRKVHEANIPCATMHVKTDNISCSLDILIGYLHAPGLF